MVYIIISGELWFFSADIFIIKDDSHAITPEVNA
jgi:hypothetical protein